MPSLNEAAVEQLAIDLLQDRGYAYIATGQQETERTGFSDVILYRRLQFAIGKLNPALPTGVCEHALRQVAALPSQDPIASNKKFYGWLVEGVAEEYQKRGDQVGARVRLIDFDNPLNNDLALCSQFSVTENNIEKRPDAVVFINGLPLVVIEFKSPTSSQATVRQAFDQLQTYKAAIPRLFCYNGLLVASDGLAAKAGSLTAGWSRFMEWKTADGVQEDPATTPQLKTMIKGMLEPKVLLDLIRHFTVFEETKTIDPKSGAISIRQDKKIAAYHQYYAVRKAVKSTIRAAGASADRTTEQPEGYGLRSVNTQPTGDRKAGVVWHTQGSGKSLSMLFYAGLLVTDRQMQNPTIVVVTDRNDLDGQLFDAFAAGSNLLRQQPVQATSRAHLKTVLKTKGGGVVFSTMQKFSPADGDENFELLSERSNIVVIADEAHRSQYGFGAKTIFVKAGVKTKYGFAKYLRDALPEASFIGFTGTPIEKEDASTPAVFGNYIDVYDIEQAIADNATVRIYYESRLVQVHLKEDAKDELDAEIGGITENEEATTAQKAKAKWARQEAIIGQSDRIKTVVADILQHLAARREASKGKAIIVATSRRIAVAMYQEIIALRPGWHDSDNSKGEAKVIMTSASSDPAAWQQHATTKQDRKLLGERFKNPDDPLAVVIVRDMWLTGFDAPSLDTIYIDKIMSGHNLMQAIARVNRIYRDKPGGLVVDYIGIASNLKRALVAYTKNGGKGAAAFNLDVAVKAMLEKHETVVQMFDGFKYQRYFGATTEEKLTVILEAQEHILGLQDGKSRFVKQVMLLSKAFALSLPDKKAMNIKEEVGFFQAIKAWLTKLEPAGNATSGVEIETAIRQIVDKAVVVGGVIDIFDAAGIKKPDISILSDDFLAEIKGMKHKNLALELLRKILSDEITVRTKQNLAQSKKFSDMLAAAIRKYTNNLVTAAQVLEELIGIAKEIQASDNRAADMGLSEDEIAFYDALVAHKNAKEVMGDDTLKELARMLVASVRKNTSIDWAVKENARARLRAIVKRLLKKYGYPPDQRKIATDRILGQAALLADTQLPR